MTKTRQFGVWRGRRCGRAVGFVVAGLMMAGCVDGAWAESVVAYATQRGGGAHEPGYLGIGFQDLSEEQAAALHLKLGNAVEVTMVDHDGPAVKAGLRPHDVIVSLNGQMLGGAVDLHKLIRDGGVGTGLALTVIRGRQTMTVNALLASRDEVQREAMARMTAPDTGGTVEIGVVETYVESAPASAAPAPSAADARGPGFIASMLHSTPFTGLAMETMEPQLAGYFGVPVGTGLLVHTVMANSPAAVAGLRAGDVVVRADAVAMRSTSDWTKRLHASKGAPIQLTVVREKREMTVTIVPDLKKRAEVEWPRFF